MRTFFSKRVIGTIIIFCLFGIFLLLYLASQSKPATITPLINTPVNLGPVHGIIGKSVQGRNIDSYAYGKGENFLAFIGGIHGGYEWNSIVLAYQFMDYLEANPKVVPDNLTVIVVPDANPDGVYKITRKEGRFTNADILTGISTVPGRFNANDVDLNRNFDCKWKPESTWQDKVVSGGKFVFSEPESQAIRNFVTENKPVAVVFLHSQSGSVYASQCGNGILPETLDIMNAYADASGYKAVKTFDAYATSGDAEGWLASIGIPALTVELTTHDSVEFEKNLAGAKALFEYYKQKAI